MFAERLYSVEVIFIYTRQCLHLYTHSEVKAILPRARVIFSLILRPRPAFCCLQYVRARGEPGNEAMKNLFITSCKEDSFL